MRRLGPTVQGAVEGLFQSLRYWINYKKSLISIQRILKDNMNHAILMIVSRLPDDQLETSNFSILLLRMKYSKITDLFLGSNRVC